VDPFNVKNFRNDFRKRVVEAEDGVATIDWVVLLAALTGLGVAMLDVTGEPLGIHAQNVRGELQDNSFETAWADNIPVGPSGEGLPDIITTSGSTGGGTTGGGTTGGGTTGGGGPPIPIRRRTPIRRPIPIPLRIPIRRPIRIPIRRRTPIPIPIRPRSRPRSRSGRRRQRGRRGRSCREQRAGLPGPRHLYRRARGHDGRRHPRQPHSSEQHDRRRRLDEPRQLRRVFRGSATSTPTRPTRWTCRA
jgi:hypothetical protein